MCAGRKMPRKAHSRSKKLSFHVLRNEGALYFPENILARRTKLERKSQARFERGRRSPLTTAYVADSQRRRSGPPAWIANRALKCAARVVEADGNGKPSTSVSRALGVVRNGESVMRNPIEIDYSHSRAIIQEIGERLRTSLKEDREPPVSLRLQIDRLRQSEGQSQQNVRGRQRVGGHAAHGREASEIMRVSHLMSAEGQKRRFDRAPSTSGLPRQPDMLAAGWHVSNVPKFRLSLAWRRSRAVETASTLGAKAVAAPPSR